MPNPNLKMPGAPGLLTPPPEPAKESPLPEVETIESASIPEQPAEEVQP